MATFLFIVLLFLFSYVILADISCAIGYGQMGMNYEEGINWNRGCKGSDYCWMAYTRDIRQVKNLFDYAWNSYYSFFYVKGCGGAFKFS